MANLTPMMKQYFEMKKKYPDAILFFRLGDFYEMFHQDAITVSRELDLTLTTRDRNKPEEERTPMCGMPYHSSEAYIARLITKGYKIAICEQTEDPTKAKGLVQRDVVRVVTAGTIMESSMLDEGKNNYLAGIYSPTPYELAHKEGNIGLVFCDISTGSIFMRNIPYSDTCIEDLCNELGRFAPTEVVLSEGAVAQKWLWNYLQEGLKVTCHEGEGFDENQGKIAYEKQFSEEKLPDSVELLRCFGGLFHYIYDTQKTELPYISKVSSLDQENFMELNLVTQRNLELTETLWRREKKGSLLWVLDKTKTSMGGRLLREWVQRPLVNLSNIKNRQNGVAELKGKPLELSQIQDNLRGIPDLERIMARISYGTASAKELRGLGEGLEKIFQLKSYLTPFSEEKLRELDENLNHLPELQELLLKALLTELPSSVREGGMIAKGFHDEVDHLNHILINGEDMIAELEQKTKEETGIRNLRVRFNRVFGYYIEVAKAQSDGVPAHWVRKQTTVNSERYISEDLKKLEESILTAKEQLVALEYEIFSKLRQETCKFLTIIQLSAQAVAELDCLCSLAFVANQKNYVAPVLNESRNLHIENGRHPVVESTLKDGLFVANHTELNDSDKICAIITGPNMAGKSTYMRQVAQIVILAQIGSFVPADSAEIGIIDQIFTRIGASDDLAAGRSTFMVEMSEVATLLKRATKSSLLILDEIGRGTSTYDGMTMAKSVLEHCRTKIGAKTLFATHYHEISSMEFEIDGIKNFNIAAKQKGDSVIFLRKILEGSADQSYGIQVAKLAGVPEEVVQRAFQILAELETGEKSPLPQRPLPSMPKEEILSPQEEIEQEILHNLKALDLDEVNPREAWEFLSKMKEKISD